MTDNIDNIQINDTNNEISFHARGYDSKRDKHYQIYQIRNRNNKFELVVVSSSELAGNSNFLLKALANAGAEIPTYNAAKNQLFKRLDEERSNNTSDVIQVTEQIGWLDNTHKTFVTRNDGIYGNLQGSKIILMDKYNSYPIFTISGTLEEWKTHIAIHCQNNANLLFAVATALTPPLMSIMNIESGGFQLVGRSSIGKTICLKCGASIYGKHISHWNSTTNAIVRNAISYNDVILIIDETGQADDPKSVVDAIYKIAGGQGKGRLNDDEAQYSWRVMLLSSSEKTTEELAIDAKKKLLLGQYVRLVDIKAESSEFGAIDNLHGYSTSKEFVEMLNDSCSKYHGTAGDDYLRQLVEWTNKDIDGCKKWITDRMEHYYKAAKIDPNKGIESRIAKRFALVYAAGKLAKKFSILPKECNVFTAVRSCHERMIIPKILVEADSVNLPSVKLDPDDYILMVKKFILHNQKNFIIIGKESKKPKNEAALANSGITYTNIKNKTEYLFMPDYFSKAVCPGYSNKAVKQSLREAGLLLCKDGATAQRPLTRGDNTTRVVAIDSAIVNFKPRKI